MRQRILLLFALVPLILTASLAHAIPDPGQPDTVKVSSTTVYRDDTTVVLRVTYKFDENNLVLATTVPLFWHSEDVIIDTFFNSWPDPEDENWEYHKGVDFTKGCARLFEMTGLTRNDVTKQSAMAWAQGISKKLIGGNYAADTLFCDIHFKILPGASSQVVPIDTGWFPPSNRLLMVNTTAQSWIPSFVPGQITIQTTTPCELAINCPGPQTANIGSPLNFGITTTATNCDPVVLTAQNVPAWATFTDNGGGAGTFSGTPGCADVGPYNVSFIATANAKADTCTVAITVNPDAVPPEVTCPADINIGNDPGQCGAIATYTATATDNCPGVSVVVIPPSGSSFPIGTTQVMGIATDAAGNKDTCYFSVTVTDTEPPIVTCPQDTTVNADPGQCYATVNYTATATDNCPGVTVVGNPPSGSQFAEGTMTQVTVTATDAHGNTAQCTFNVTVNPVPDQFVANPASLTFNYQIGNPFPGNQTVALTNSGCGPIDFTVTEGAAWLAVDPMSGATPATLTFAVDPTGLAEGSYPTDVTIAGAGVPNLIVPVTLNVLPSGNNPPEFVTCPGPLQITEGQYLYTYVYAVDPNPGDHVTYTAENVPAGAVVVSDSILAWTPYCYQAGQYLVRFIGTDEGGLADTCEIMIEVLDSPIELQAAPVSLTFNYTIGDPPPAAQQVLITNAGCGAIEVGWSINGETWLNVAPLTGQTPAPFDVAVNPTGLPAGVYQTEILFSPTPRSATPVPHVLVPVTLNVASMCQATSTVGNAFGNVGAQVAVPVSFHNCVGLAGMSIPLRWNPDLVTLDSIDFTGSRVEHLSLKSDQGNINNAGNSVLLWAIVISEGPIAPGDGLFANLLFTINACGGPVVIDTGFIPPAGFYLFADYPNGNPVPTAFTRGSIGIGPGDLTPILTPEHFEFVAPACDVNPDCQTLSITTGYCYPQMAIWNASEHSSWMSVDPMSGQFPGSADVCVDIAGLAPGMYHDTIFVTASELPATVPPMAIATVTLVVPECLPLIVLNQGVFMLDAMKCEPGNVDSATLNITNGGGGQLNWSVAWDAPWLTFAPNAGTAPPASTVTITVNGLGMAPGVYVDTAMITANAINSPQYVIVHMAVMDNCPLPGDTVWVGHSSGSLGEDVVIPVTFMNTQELSGLSIPLKYSSAHVKAISGDFTGSRVEYLSTKFVTINEAERTICIAAIPLQEPLIPAGNGLLVNLHFTVVSDDGCPDPVVVTIDTTVVPPGCVLMFTDEFANPLYPEFFAGSITIECPERCPAVDPIVTPFVADWWGMAGYVDDQGVPHAAMPGDVITALDPQRVLCGVAVVEQQGLFLIHVYGDDYLTTPDVDEGAVVGDSITFYLNCDYDCPLEATNRWVNHASYYENLLFVCRRCIEPELCGAWALISYNVQVPDQTIPNVLATILPPSAEAKQVISNICGYGAATWVKNRPVNDLTIMDNLHGYWVYAPGGEQVQFCGRPVPPSTPIELCEEWNVISYLPNDEDDLVHAWASILGDVTFAYGFECAGGIKTYDPLRPLNDLKCLRPGYGYWVKMDAAATLTYPTGGYECTDVGDNLPKVVNLTSSVVPTPWACDFWSYGSEGGPATGSVLTVRDEQSIICGQAVVLKGGMFLIHVYGDDPNTAVDEGALAGSRLTFETDGVQYEVVGSDIWTERGSIEITLTRSGGQGQIPAAYELSQNYPNPFNPFTTIRFRMPDQMHVTLSIYNVLGQKVRTLIDDVLPAGEHQVGWDGVYDSGQRAESGVYFYRISTAAFTDVRKMTLLK